MTKIKLKKITIALAALTASTVSYAAMYVAPVAPVACVQGSVVTPCEGNGWDIGIDGLYIKPYNNSSSAIQTEYTRVGNTINAHNVLYTPKWVGGLRIYGSYQFLDGKFLAVDWTYFKNNTQRIDPTSTAFPGFPGYTRLTQFTDNNIRFNEVNVKLGQTLQVGERASLNYYGGLRFADIRNDFTVRVTVPTLANVQIANAVNNNEFDGVGPVFGGKLSYLVGNGFSLFGEGAAALLLSKSETDVTIVTTLPGTAALTYTENLDEHRGVISLDGKLGAQFAWIMSQGSVAIRAGWQATHYNFALTRVGTAFISTTGPTAGFILPILGVHSFNYHGPFLGLDAHLNT